MYTLDRFARNRYDSAIYKAKLKKNGVRVFYAKQPMPDTPEGIILESVLEGYAEYYSENLARNIKRGIRENALQGLATGGASVMLGYSVGEDRKYIVDPVGAKIVQEIFQLYADGMSATQVVNYCNERGYKTARGNAFNKNSLRTILQNEKYIGTYKLMDVVIPNGMPAIIDKKLFDKVQLMLDHNKKARARTKAHEDYLLTTKLFCGHCGSPMVGESGTSKTGQVHYYYKCTKAKRQHTCRKKSEKKDWIEQVVVRYTVEKVLTDENIGLIAKKAMEIIKKESADTTYLDGLNADLKEIQKKIKNLVTAIEQGIITPTTKERLDELEQEKSNVEGLIAREELKKPLLNESRIRYWLTSFKSGDVTNKDYQRRIIDTLVNSVYVYDEDDGGKKLVFTFNLSGNNTATLSSSDIACYAPPLCACTNQIRGWSNLYHQFWLCHGKSATMRQQNSSHLMWLLFSFPFAQIVIIIRNVKFSSVCQQKSTIADIFQPKEYIAMVRILLSRLLGERRWTQADLARVTGIRAATINEYYHELADRVSLQHLELICNALDCDLSDLLVLMPDDAYKAHPKRKSKTKV